jgi:hypothetical protein
MKRLQEKPATKNNSKKQYPKGNSKIQVVEKVKFNFGKGKPNVKTALVIGSTGLIGSELLKILLESPEYTQVVTFVKEI